MTTLSLMVYFDAASGEPLDPAGREAYLAALDEGWAGPDRLYREGRRARMLLDAAREAVAEVLGCRADELVFTGSGTSAVHQGVLGLAKGRARAGKTLLLSAVEHSAVIHAAELAAARNGGERRFIPVDEYGRVKPESLTESLGGLSVGLLAVQSANHEVGTRQPLKEIADMASGSGVPLLVDAAASIGREPVPAGWSVLTGSARKWGGPTGVGVLAVRKGTRFAADWPQDERERGWSPGPVDVPAILAAATALRARSAEAQEAGLNHRELTALLRTRIPQLIPDVQLVGDPEDRVPHILTFSCLYASGEALLLELDRQGFSVSSGSSCTASTLTPSHVLEAMGVLSQGNIRVSLPWDARLADVERFLEVLPEAVRSARPEPDPVEAAAEPGGLELDMLGRLCPIPVIELGKRIGGVPLGAVIRVLADDPAARLDIPAWCRMTGQEMVGTEALADRPEPALAYLVRRVR